VVCTHSYCLGRKRAEYLRRQWVSAGVLLAKLVSERRNNASRGIVSKRCKTMFVRTYRSQSQGVVGVYLQTRTGVVRLLEESKGKEGSKTGIMTLAAMATLLASALPASHPPHLALSALGFTIFD